MELRLVRSDGMKVELEPGQERQLSAPEAIRAALTREDAVGFDAYDGSALIGFAMLRRYAEDGWFLWDFAVDRRFQRCGYGSAVLRVLAGYMRERYGAREMTTTYLWGNMPAKGLYEKAGFVETDVVDEPGCHEVNMLWKLEE